MTCGLLFASVAVHVASAVINLQRVRLIDRVLDHPGTTSIDEVLRSDQQVSDIGLAQLIVLALTALAFILWFVTTYRALYRRRPNGLRYSPGWAVGGWLVPFLNLVRPYQMAHDAWFVAEGRIPPRRSRHWGLVRFWWFTWIIANAIRGPGFGAGDSLEAIRGYALRNVVGDPIGAMAGVLAVAVVITLSGRVIAIAQKLPAT